MIAYQSTKITGCRVGPEPSGSVSSKGIGFSVTVD